METVQPSNGEASKRARTNMEISPGNAFAANTLAQEVYWIYKIFKKALNNPKSLPDV